MAVPRAAQRNHHSARDASLAMASLRAAGAQLGERRHLDEVEVVEQADPGDAEEHVQPPEGAGETGSLEQLEGNVPRCISLSDATAGNVPPASSSVPRCVAMAPQFIFTTHKLGRFYPPDRTVLEDISLSFYPGAKIGVIGANGAGKSSLLRVMAGLDDGFSGEARLTPGFTRRLPRPGAAARPVQGRPRQRARRRGAGRGPSSTATTRSWPCGATPMPTTRRSAPSRPSSRTRSTPPTPGTSTATSRSPWTRCAARPTTPTSPSLSGGERRRVALCRLLLSAPRPAAARRAHQPPRRRVGGLARALPAGVPGHRRGHHPRPVLPRQRGPVDPRARPGPGLPVRGQLLVVARPEAGAARPRRRSRRRPASARCSASSNGCAWRPRPARRRAGPACRPTRSCGPRPRPTPAPATASRSPSRPGPASATR